MPFEESHRDWGVNLTLTHVCTVMGSMVGQSGYPANQTFVGAAVNDFSFHSWAKRREMEIDYRTYLGLPPLG